MEMNDFHLPALSRGENAGDGRGVVMPNFELLYAELEDLAADDPMRPAAIVHVLGNDAQPCRDRIMTKHSIYVIGRGQLPPEVGKDGYFFVASRPDYSVLQSALADFWPDVPGFPLHLRRNEAALPVLSQETADVMNYIAKPPLHDPRIFREARKRLRGLVPKKHLVATAYVTQWLVENMSPANNCYTLSALFARWLKEHGASAEYCEGHATLRRPRRPLVTIPHAWVDVNGEVCDLTVDRQGDWGDFSTSVARIRVNNSCIVYETGGSKYGGLEAF